MSRELKALEKINEIILPYSEAKQDYLRPRDVCQNEFEIIETALKKYEEMTNTSVVLGVRTHGHTQALIDTICKNYKDVKITNLEDEKKVKAFDIIKEKNVNVRAFKKVLLMTQNDDVKLNSYNSQNHRYEDDLTKDDFDLLKEVLL